MSGNMETVRAHYAASDAKDIAGMMAIVTPQTAWTEMAGFPCAGTYVGPEAIVAGVFKRLGTEWQGYGFALDRLFDAGDAIIATGDYTGTYPGTGKSFDARVVHLWQFEDGKLRTFEQFTDTKLIADAMV